MSRAGHPIGLDWKWELDVEASNFPVVPSNCILETDGQGCSHPPGGFWVCTSTETLECSSQGPYAEEGG